MESCKNQDLHTGVGWAVYERKRVELRNTRLPPGAPDHSLSGYRIPGTNPPENGPPLNRMRLRAPKKRRTRKDDEDDPFPRIADHQEPALAW